MEFATQKTIKRQDIWTLDLPNLKECCFVPNKVEFWMSVATTPTVVAPSASSSTSGATGAPIVPEASKTLVPGAGDVEVAFYSSSNCICKWSVPYFKLYNYLDLSLYLNKIGEGENISLQIKNADREEKELTLKVIYKEYQGNIIYCNSYDSSLIQTEVSNPLHDLAAVGLVTNIQIHTEVKMLGVIIEPIFHVKEEDSARLRGFPTGSICVESDVPTSSIEIALEQLQEYQNAMKYFRPRIIWDPSVDVKETRKSKVHIVAHGFKN